MIMFYLCRTHPSFTLLCISWKTKKPTHKTPVCSNDSKKKKNKSPQLNRIPPSITYSTLHLFPFPCSSSSRAPSFIQRAKEEEDLAVRKGGGSNAKERDPEVPLWGWPCSKMTFSNKSLKDSNVLLSPAGWQAAGWQGASYLYLGFPVTFPVLCKYQQFLGCTVLCYG